MQHEVVFSASALDDLRGIYDWIFDRAGPDIADAYLERVESACRSLGSFPLRGTPRDELTAGLRTIAFERRAVIAYTVDGSTITIRRVLYGGRDLPAALGDAWGCDGSHWEGWRRPLDPPPWPRHRAAMTAAPAAPAAHRWWRVQHPGRAAD